MLLVKNILHEHDRSTFKESLKNNLGDGYLLEHNPVYRAVRIAALRARFSFSDERFHDYDVLPLTQLPRILKSKVIPYIDNVRALREIEGVSPGSFTLAEVPALRANRIFHESAHAAAHTILSKYIRDKGKNDLERAFRILLQEAFANAVESLANVYANNRVHNEFLYKNSYIMEKPTTRKTIGESISALGVELTFVVLVFSFLYANFLQTKKAKKEFPALLKLLTVNASPKAASKLKKVFSTGLDLDPEFTMFTNRFCLKLAGLKVTPDKLTNTSLLNWFKDSSYVECIEEMVATVCTF